MEISMIVQSKTTAADGAVTTTLTDYAPIAESITLTSTRFDSPAKMAFKTIEDSAVSIAEGSSVELTVDGVKMFKGYVFTASRTKDGETSYTAYDQLRYLKAKASYTFEVMTLGQIITKIAGDFGLTVGTLEETGYAFPCLIKENETCLDIIFDALSETIIQTGRIFVFYDKAGELSLIEAKNMLSTVLLGDASLLTEYTYKRDIDSSTYNRIKLARPNSETGRADVYVYEDTDNIGKWGLLQYYDSVDENLNAAQIDEMCKLYLQYYNRVMQTINITTFGVVGIVAGSIVPVRISKVNDLAVTRLLLTEKVTHKISEEEHTMTIEVKNFEQLGGVSVVE